MTRFAHAQYALRNESYNQFCPSCRRWVLRDGWQGSRNAQNFCSPSCQRRFHQYTHPLNTRKLGGAFPMTAGRTVVAGKTI